MSRTQGVDTNPKNTNREIGSYEHSLTYQGTGGGRSGSGGNITTNRTYVLVANYQDGSLNLFSAGIFGERGSPVASKDANGRWQVSQTSGFTQNEIKALQTSLNAGTFGRKLNNEAKEVATRDLGADQYKRIFNPSVASTSENGSTSGGGTNPSTGSNGGDSGSQQQSSSQLTPEQQSALLNTISKGQKARTKYEENLKYPESYEGNDFLTVEMIRYVPESNLSLGGNPESAGEESGGALLGGTLRRIGERSGKESAIAKITLPIPSNLVDANPVEWGSSSLNPLQAYGAGAAARILTGGNFAESLGNEVRGAGNVLSKQGDAIKPILNSAIVGQILGLSNQDLLTRSTGAIVNPNTELLFKGPSLRTFTFSFKMTPRSKNESDIIRKIIRRFKQGMSVKRAASGIFLASPNVFRLQFWYVPPVSENNEVGGGVPKEHPYLPKFKICALQNISVNYMPDGSYMTYGDGSMIGYDMTLTFSEIDPIFDEDYTELDKDQDTVIGY
jgi:hypothetical protein